MANQKKELKVVYPDDFNVNYTNFAGFSMSPYDLHIDFAIRHDGPEVSEAKMHTRITMSPQHAKVLVSKISEILVNYEKDFGEIATQPKKNK